MTKIRAPFDHTYESLLTAALIFLAFGALLAAVVAIAKQPNVCALVITIGYILQIPLIVEATRKNDAQRWILVALIVSVTLSVRIASLNLIGDTALTNDPMNYSNIAHAILNGDGMVVTDWRYGNNLRAYFPPLFPLVLAGWWTVFGDTLWAILWLNVITAFACAWALADCGRLWGQRDAGDAAALLFITYPSFAVTAGIPNKELLVMLLGILFLRTILVLDQRKSAENPWPIAAIFGGLWALMALTQAALAVMPPVVALILMPRYGFTALALLGIRALPFFILVMSPWWVRNWIIFGTFVPFTTAAGFMINVMLGDARLAIPQEIFLLPEPERSGRMAEMAMARIVEVPGEFAKSVLIAFARGFGYEEASVAVYRSMYPTIADQTRATLTPPLQFAYAALLAAAAAQCRFLCRSFWQGGTRDPIASVAFAVLVSIVAINIWFEFGERHRYQMTPLLMLLAAAWLTRHWPRRVA